MTSNNQTSYKSILKATAIFGSTQVFQMITMLLRGKIAAIFLGPLGIGINSIFQTTVVTVSQFASCGLFQSGVRDISKANINENRDELQKVLYIFTSLTNVLAIFGAIILMLMSYPMSVFSFGNADFTFSFLVLGFGVLFYTLSQRQLSILQGTMQTRNLAKASLYAAISHTGLSLLFYSQYGSSGIIPAIVIGFLAQYIVFYMLTDKIIIDKPNFKLNELFILGKPMLSLGFVLMLSVFIINLFTLALNAIMSNLGHVSDVGYFQAAFSITNGNILILISVLSSDYFPRLSANIHNKGATNIIINQQVELMILVTAPITIILISMSSIVVKLLLSADFLVIIPMLKLMSLALLFRIVWQSMSYVILANGDKKTYFIFDALIGNGFAFLCNIFFYLKWGLIGLGYSFVFSSIAVALLLYIVARRNYKISFNYQFIRTLIILIIPCGLCYFISVSSFESKIALILLCVLTPIYSLYIIQKRINISFLRYFKSKRS